MRASRRRDLNVKGPQRAETAPISVARQGPLTCPLATFAVAVCYVRNTSTSAFIAHVDLYPRVRPFETIALTDCPKARSLSD